VRVHTARPRVASLKRLALLGCLLTNGCYVGSAKNATLTDLTGEEGPPYAKAATRTVVPLRWPWYSGIGTFRSRVTV